MSNSRPFRRRVAAVRSGRAKTRARFPWGPPSLSTVRRQLRKLEAEGFVEQTVLRTGKPGGQPHGWRLTDKGRDRRDWSADELEMMITTAVNERRFRDVPYLLPLLRARDRERAKRLEKSLIRHGYRAKGLPRGRHAGPWRPGGRAAPRLPVRADGSDHALEAMISLDAEAGHA